MANVTVNYAKTMQKFQGIKPYGNRSAIQCTFETNASGVFVDTDQATAVIQTDVVRLGPVLPAGMTLLDAFVIVSDAFTAATTCSIGFQYADGVDSTTVPQDADYFFAAGLDTATAGRTRMSNTGVAPVTIPKDVYIIMTIAGADHASVGVMDVIVEGIMEGIE